MRPPPTCAFCGLIVVMTVPGWRRSGTSYAHACCVADLRRHRLEDTCKPDCPCAELAQLFRRRSRSRHADHSPTLARAVARRRAQQ